MDYILDTHVCLWAFGDYERISPNAKSILENENAKIFISQMSIFEIAIKLNIGKLVDFKIKMNAFIKHL